MMKKKFWMGFAAVLLTVAMALSFAGCGSSDAGDVDAKKIINSLIENQSATDTSMTMNLHYGMRSPLMGDASQASVEMDLTVDMAYKQDPMQGHMLLKGDVTAAGEKQKMQVEMYLVPDGKDHVAYLYSSDDSKWIKQPISEKEMAEVKGNMAEYLQSAMSSEALQQSQELRKKLLEKADFQADGRERVGSVNAAVLKSDLSVRDILEVLQDANVEGVEDLFSLLYEGQQLSMDIFDESLDLRLYVDDNEMRIVKISIDAKEAIQKIVSRAIAEMMAAYGASSDVSSMDTSSLISIDAADISIVVTGYGDAVAEIEVPKSVKDSAVEVTADGESDGDEAAVLGSLFPTNENKAV